MKDSLFGKKVILWIIHIRSWNFYIFVSCSLLAYFWRNTLKAEKRGLLWIPVGFSGGSVVKNLPVMHETEDWLLGRDRGLMPGTRRSPGRGHGNPLQYSCLEIPWTEESGGLLSVGLGRVRQNWSNLAGRLWIPSCRCSFPGTSWFTGHLSHSACLPALAWLRSRGQGPKRPLELPRLGGLHSGLGPEGGFVFSARLSSFNLSLSVLSSLLLLHFF